MANILGVGIATLDIINYVDHYPNEDEELRAVSQRICRGGNVTNTLSVLSQLDHQCFWCGVLCEDNDVQYILDDLHTNNIDHSYSQRIQQGKIPTSYITINQKSGSRTIVHYRDLPELSYQHFQTLLFDEIDWFHFEARAINETCEMILEVKRRHPDARISVEIEKPRDQLSEIFGLADLYLYSKHFAEANGYQSPEVLLDAHKNLSPNADLVCTWGEQGAHALLHNGEKHFSPAFSPQKVVDTLGAGDTFNAGLISALANNINWLEALPFACRLAGKKCGQTGLENLV